MKSINIYNFFPIENSDMMDQYLASDDDFEERKRQFFSIILLAVPDSNKGFGNAIIKATFGLDYVINYRWPTVG